MDPVPQVLRHSVVDLFDREAFVEAVLKPISEKYKQYYGSSLTNILRITKFSEQLSQITFIFVVENDKQIKSK